jgi:hypothetical protein
MDYDNIQEIESSSRIKITKDFEDVILTFKFEYWNQTS